MADTRADGARAAYPLFNQGGDGGSRPTSALQLTVEPIDLDLARALNRLWHSRLPKLDRHVAAWLCFGAEAGGRWYAAAVWSLPVARSIPQYGTCLELRRLAVAPDAPRNAASRLLGVMARLIRRERPAVVRLVSYQDTAVHTGGIYRAAGWVPAATSREGDDWVRPGAGRHRPVAQSTAAKVRWEREL